MRTTCPAFSLSEKEGLLTLFDSAVPPPMSWHTSLLCFLTDIPGQSRVAFFKVLAFVSQPPFCPFLPESSK